MTVYPGRRRDPCHEWRKNPLCCRTAISGGVSFLGGHPGRLAEKIPHKRDDGGAAEAVHELPVLSRCLFSLCSRSHNLFVNSPINTARVILHLPWPLDPAEFLGNGKSVNRDALVTMFTPAHQLNLSLVPARVVICFDANGAGWTRRALSRALGFDERA